jgi:hypothetical protein
LKHPNPNIADIINVQFDPKYTFDTKLGQYVAMFTSEEEKEAKA